MEKRIIQGLARTGEVRRSINETLSNLFGGKRKVSVFVSQEAGEYRYQIVNAGVVASLHIQEIGGGL